MPTVLRATGLFLLTSCTVLGQTPDAKLTPGDAMVEAHLILETNQLSRRVLNGADSKESWETGREELKRQYFDMLGLWPLPEKTPLKATVTGTLQRDSVQIEKVHFQSKPGLYVTGNLYRPAKTEGKLPAVLYVCGHLGKGRDGNKTGFQHHGMWFATHGYICLIIDTLQLGEIAGTHHGTYNKERWWWHSAGYTPAGVECWNGVRALDYLVSRPDVDAEKLAVTGISGGGASTFWIAAADERVKVCVPVSGMSDLQSYVDDKVCNGHCDCMFLYNTYRWEWATIAALVAPRAMLFENSGHDTIFPMPANERIRERLARIYEWYEKKPGDLFDIGITPGGHSDNVELRLMAYRWINKHLKGDNAEVSEPTLPVIDGKDLRVFPDDNDFPSDRLNAVIDETFVPVGNPQPPKNHAEFLVWSKQLTDQLEERVFREWQDQVPAAEIRARRQESQFVLNTDDEVMVLAARHEVAQKVPRSPEHRERLWLIVLNSDEPEATLPKWVETAKIGGQSTLTLSPRGCGSSLAWTRKNPPNYAERAHALVGRTVDAGRVYDIQAVARWLHEAEGNELTIGVAGRGAAGVLGAYAALFEPSISEIVILDPPVTHREAPILLNVLRVLDIPDALGLLAPRHLTLINADDKAFQRTEQIYKAAGYGDRIVRKSRSDK